ncbi:MAG: protein-disulfide reductase DsbD family protein [Thiolinea sp.]
MRALPSSEPLPPEQAFQPGAVTWDGRELMVSWQVQPGYYCCRIDQFQVELLAAEGFELGDMQLPRGEIRKMSISAQLRPCTILCPSVCR